MALLGDGQGQENAGRDGHMTHDIADREQHPAIVIMMSHMEMKFNGI